MHCPTCNRERTRIYRVQSDGDPTSRVLTRLCKNPDCGTIFTTLESLLTVIQSPANKPHMREITGLLARLAPTDLAAVQKFLASLPSVPIRQPPAKAKG